LTDFVLLTCEHGGNRVPAEFAALFQDHRELLESHRGYDPGALDLARTCERRFKAPLHYSTVTRLLVELNRSTGHPALFSVVARALGKEVRASIVSKYYVPYRSRVEAEVERARRRGRRVIHVSLHTFTPVYNGKKRSADIGLLYDPSRRGEAVCCGILKRSLGVRRRDLIVRRNYPYLGKSDGFTTALRKKLSGSDYVGIEIEVNQRWYFGDRAAWRNLQRDLADSLLESLHSFADE
jgi:predicted N-formylglutamate amidohydrolase